jgi:TolA-binding protein
MLTTYPESHLISEIPYLLATCYKRLKDDDRAIQYYKQVLEKYPNSKYAHRVPYNLGLLYRKYKQYDQSIYWFEQQPKLYSNEPTSACALLWEGNIYLFRIKDYLKASEKFQEYTELYPEYDGAPEAFCSWATCMEKMGFMDDAANLLEKILVEYPDSVYTEHARNKLTQLKEVK